MAKFANYEGGAWAIGGVMSRRAKRPKRPSLAWLVARRARVLELRAYVQQHGGWLSDGILAYYKRELQDLDALIAAKRVQKSLKVSHEGTPATVGGS